MINQTKSPQNASKQIAFKQVLKLCYVECQKEGLHFGEVCNMVCMEPSCLQDSVCCCACIEQNHKKHLTKPLKMIMNQAKLQSEKAKPTNFNIDVILDIMNQSQKETLDIFQNCKKEILNNLDDIEKSLLGYYSSISEQIRLKNSDPKVEVSAAFDIITAAKTTEKIKTEVKKLVAMIPASKGEKEEETGEITESELISAMKNSNDEVNKMITKNILQVNVKLKQYQKVFENQVNNTNIWKKINVFTFSPTYKHPDIKLLNEFHIKSLNTSGYKFAIMDPSLEIGNPIKKIHFKIRECSSNWVAVGMCHKNIVSSKGYAFNFSSLGHGGYMISANGGTWSNSNVDFNNKVKAFKFAKNDIIEITVDMNTKKILFKKNFETFEIPFMKIQGDQLHPCALFYYMNDQVEFLHNYKP